MDKADLARTFLGGGAMYERYRPGFPQAAVDRILTRRVSDVLDLGAGTGKLTRLLVGGADHVTAVDPSASMLDQLRLAVPGVTAVQGTAESIPLADASQDAVTVAQAFHWFDEECACAEIARVLRPGGMLALLWNTTDTTCSWDVACERIAHPAPTGPDVDQGTPPVAGALPGFVPTDAAWVPWSEPITREDYLARWCTVSTLMAADASGRRTLLDRIEAVLDADDETRGRTVLPLRQVTEVLVYRRQDGLPCPR